jgi:hypothetical protein
MGLRADRSLIAFGAGWVAAVALAAGAAVQNRGAVALLAAAAAIGLLLLAVDNPRPVFYGSLVVLALLPLYGLGGLPPRLASPALIGLWALAIASLIRHRTFNTITAVDLCVGLVAVGFLLADQAGNVTGKELFRHIWLWLGPYMAGRYITQVGDGRTLLKALGFAALIALPFLAIELVSTNPFIQHFPAASSEGIGQSSEMRFGSSRAQGAFGHPIAFAMFLSTCAVACIAVWMSRSRAASPWWLALAGALVIAQATTLSRTGWLILAISAVGLLLFASRELFRPRNRVLLIPGVIMVFVGLSVGPTRNVLFGGGNLVEQQNLQVGAQYRNQLLDIALKPGTIKAFGGSPQPQTYVNSVDNGFLLVALQLGLLPVIGLLLLIPVLLALAYAHRNDVTSVAIYVIAAANLVALFGVALITQSQCIVWLLVGAAAGQAAAVRARGYAVKSISAMTE